MTTDEEKGIVEGIVTMAEWGFLVDATTLRVIVRKFFMEIKTDVLKGKLPGRDFIYSFLNHHRDILSLHLFLTTRERELLCPLRC